MGTKLVAVSGGFDPLHIGHLLHIEKARALGDCLIVIVATDEMLVWKKKYTFQPLKDRLEIVRALRWVDEATPCIDKDGSSAATLRAIHPDVYAKGGDRTPGNMIQSEIDVCQEMGIEIIYNVGFQLRSSQEIVKRCQCDPNCCPTS